MRVSMSFGGPLPEPEAIRPASSDSFRLLVVGDFGATAPGRRPIMIDRDNFDEVFERLQVQVCLPGDQDLPETRLQLTEMDDLHPDQLFHQVKLFDALRERRRRLQNSETFAAEARLLTEDQHSGTDAGAKVDAADAETLPPVADMQDLLNQTLEQTQAAAKPVVQQIAEGAVDIDEYVRRVVAPYVLEKADPRQAELISSVDQAIAGTMRKVLHHPNFQHIEAAWTGLKMLVRRLETDATLQIGLLNLPKEKLNADLHRTEELQTSELYKLLADDVSVQGSEPWSLVVANYTFSADADEISLMGRLARVLAASGTPLMAAGTPAIAGCRDLAATPDPDHWQTVPAETLDRWLTLRSLPEAQFLSLLVPRTLGRRPYGERSNSIDSFDFEEIPDGRAHQDYLWMNPVFAAATLIGETFTRVGANLRAGWISELTSLPIHVYSADGEEQLKPCAETELTLKAGNILAEAGLTVVYSVRGSDSVRIPCLRSLSIKEQSFSRLGL